MQKLIIKNKYQSPNRINILTAAGIAQINEPIFPQNGERIWGGLGVVTFNQASQYSEEENPDTPITPPNCTNCGGGIPPEVPPEKISSLICTSECGDIEPFSVSVFNAPGFMLRNSTQNKDTQVYVNGTVNQDYSLTKTFKLYDDAYNYMVEKALEKLPDFEQYLPELMNTFYASNDYIQIEQFSQVGEASAKFRNKNFRKCVSYTEFSDGSRTDSITNGYDINGSGQEKMIFSIYFNYYRKYSCGERIWISDDWVMARISYYRSYNDRCTKCTDCQRV